MASTSLNGIDLTVEPDLQPLYPTPSQLAHLLSPNVGLSPAQKTELIHHCLARACVFGDFTLLSYLLSDPNAQPFLDLSRQDEDGLGLISMTILGFGSESERDVEREECVRQLIAEGADVNLPDNGACPAIPDGMACLTESPSWLDFASPRRAPGPTDSRLAPPHTWLLTICYHPTQLDCTGHRDRVLRHAWTRGRASTSRGSYARKGVDWRSYGGAPAG